jgi:hypothetical protein
MRLITMDSGLGEAHRHRTHRRAGRRSKASLRRGPSIPATSSLGSATTRSCGGARSSATSLSARAPVDRRRRRAGNLRHPLRARVAGSAGDALRPSGGGSDRREAGCGSGPRGAYPLCAGQLLRGRVRPRIRRRVVSDTLHQEKADVCEMLLQKVTTPFGLLDRSSSRRCFWTRAGRVPCWPVMRSLILLLVVEDELTP